MRNRDNELSAAYRHCEKLARGSGSNFFFAFYSLPKQMFREMCALYAYMRMTDDLGDDESLSLADRQLKLQEWRRNLHAAYHNEPVNVPVLRAIVDVAQRRGITLQHLEEVINGVESDLSPVEFQSFDELNQYCYQVAGAVGICCLKVWGCDFSIKDLHQRAIDCGTAFQLTNILRDLGEDAARGRLYLPLEDLERFHLTKQDIFSAEMTESLRELMQFQVSRAWAFYRKALPLLDEVSTTGKPILSGFMQAYSSLLKQIEKQNYDVFSKQVRLSKRRKSMIVLRSALRISGRITIPE